MVSSMFQHSKSFEYFFKFYQDKKKFKKRQAASAVKYHFNFQKNGNHIKLNKDGNK